jgi:hypothetical protein
LEQTINMDLSKNKKSKRKHLREKVKIHYRQKVKLKKRASGWIRFNKYVSKNRKMLTVSTLLVAGLIIALTSVVLTIKQKSDKINEMREMKFTAPAS